MQKEFLSISKNQKVCSQPSASKMSEPVCRLANNTEMQMPTLSRQLSQTNNSSVKPLVLGHKTQLASQLCPTRLTEVGDLRRLWNDNKEKSGMWSEVMGPWVCNSAGMCGLKPWVFGYACLHGNGICLDFKKSKGL